LAVVFVLAGWDSLTRASQTAEPANWPQFRGPEARGVAEGTALPERWSATENVAWKTDIPGRGWSSPIVWGQRIFLTTVVNLGESEEPKKGLYLGGNRKTPPDSVHQWKTFCLDLESGQIVWERQVHEGKPQTSRHLRKKGVRNLNIQILAPIVPECRSELDTGAPNS
jgi:hypothetical protein